MSVISVMPEATAESLANVELFNRMADVSYPTNQAGGIGRVSVHGNIRNDSVTVELKSYGCGYNQPVIENIDELKNIFGTKLEIVNV